MTKSFPLDQNEMMAIAACHAEHRNLMEEYGANTIERERLRRAIPQAEQQKLQFVRGLAAKKGARGYLSARVEGNALVCEFADEPAPAPEPPPQAINGAAHDAIR